MPDKGIYVMFGNKLFYEPPEGGEGTYLGKNHPTDTEKWAEQGDAGIALDAKGNFYIANTFGSVGTDDHTLVKLKPDLSPISVPFTSLQWGTSPWESPGTLVYRDDHIWLIATSTDNNDDLVYKIKPNGTVVARYGPPTGVYPGGDVGATIASEYVYWATPEDIRRWSLVNNTEEILVTHPYHPSSDYYSIDVDPETLEIWAIDNWGSLIFHYDANGNLIKELSMRGDPDVISGPESILITPEVIWVGATGHSDGALAFAKVDPDTGAGATTRIGHLPTDETTTAAGLIVNMRQIPIGLIPYLRQRQRDDNLRQQKGVNPSSIQASLRQKENTYL